MNQPVYDLTERGVLVAGGWSLAHARLLRLEQVGDEALALVDGNGNGDGYEVEAEFWWRQDGAWIIGGSSGTGSLHGPNSWTGQQGGRVWSVGHGRPNSHVVIRCDGEEHRIPVDGDGLWLLSRDPDWGGEHPTVVG